MLLKVGSRFGVGPVTSERDSSHPTLPSVETTTKVQQSKRLLMGLLIARSNSRADRTPPASLGGFRTEAPEEVDDVPHVVGRHLAAMAFHLGIAAHAVGDDGEDLAVAGSVYPLGVGEVGRAWILGRERAIA